MTASDLTSSPSGSAPALLTSRTLPATAASAASSRLSAAGGPGTAAGRSSRPCVTMVPTIRVTMSSSRSRPMRPLVKSSGAAPLGVVQPREVKARPRGRHRIANREHEVGGDESSPSPQVFQRAEQFRILAGVAAVDLVVRTHDGPGAGVQESTPERRKVDLFQGPAGDADVDRWPAVRWRPAGPGPAGLEVIHHEVLDHGHDVPLRAPDVCRSQGSGQVRVFPERLGLPSGQRRACDVQRRSEQDVVTG